MAEPLRARDIHVQPFDRVPDRLLGLPVITSALLPPGQALILGGNVVVLSTVPRPRPLTRRQRLRRWLRALPHRLCPC